MVNKKDVQAGEEHSIQDDLIQLSELITWFQSDDFELEKATQTYEEAEALAKKIETNLDGLKNEITVIRQRFEDSAE